MKELATFIGSKIREYRKQKGMTQTELADKLNISKQTVSKYEKGVIKANQDTLFLLSDIFSISVNDFFPPTTENPAPKSNSKDTEPIPVEDLENRFMTFDGKPLTDDDLRAIQTIIEVYLGKNNNGGN